MNRLTFATIAFIALPFAASSEGLWNKVKDGASKTGEVIGNTANDVGSAVEDTLTSTTKMVSGEETPELTRQSIDNLANDTLELLFSVNAEAKALYDQSFGYAVFDARQLTVIGATAGYGRGVAIETDTGARTYMKMGTGGVGISLGIGGFERKIIVLFENRVLFDEFVDNGYDATAQAGSMVGDEKESEEVQFVDGRSIFVLTQKGWKVSATAAGTKYWKDTELN